MPNKYAKFVPKEMLTLGIRENNIEFPEITIGTYT